ncbi:hypothetical protein DM02DRAFT_260419 [Periconia macrospinosa]|uniref:Uncharacterized protein n=1 Tax=Periconia macrospinosa TaxID=97972 RepID=A0A2V1E1F3_9PLEO|nr:hypothetical protein DM02DRAFT_260419 [Periconia macrospinosa]
MLNTILSYINIRPTTTYLSTKKKPPSPHPLPQKKPPTTTTFPHFQTQPFNATQKSPHSIPTPLSSFFQNNVSESSTFVTTVRAQQAAKSGEIP